MSFSHHTAGYQLEDRWTYHVPGTTYTINNGRLMTCENDQSAGHCVLRSIIKTAHGIEYRMGKHCVMRVAQFDNSTQQQKQKIVQTRYIRRWTTGEEEKKRNELRWTMARLASKRLQGRVRRAPKYSHFPDFRPSKLQFYGLY